MTTQTSKPAAPRSINPIPAISFPEGLPVSARRDEIAKAVGQHQVVIVCGETGSGKTTQLPKIALSLGHGWGAGGYGLIGHTQPRRLAATSVAKRIAQELGTPLGDVVGYKIRFQDRLHPGASVKLMTDGILLAETQGDPLLRQYQTLIIDEAHERSLNIDFLLGHLKHILPRRPDLKVIVTSATIDADRFAKHFESAHGPAPVIMVSGRTFPVEVRYRPIDERQGTQLNEAVALAVDELWQSGGGGDILVFLPGEREIREGADALRRHLQLQQRSGPTPEIIPLFARLSQAEQDRVFETGQGRRVVMSTNVAETSLTVPGIRYVIDAGHARVKRYSYRNKVEQLQVEAISQSSANQRAGRCGRVANGICIRLYDEADFNGRPKFTDPEILRSSLAGVILRMKSLGLGAVEDFAFLEAPTRKAIADGYDLLSELGAVDDVNQLTALGVALSKLPLDPRIGRMILAARDHQCLDEVLIIASALSVQDVRDRPLDHQQAADEKQKQFDDERSEFVSYLKLWAWLDAGRGVHGHQASKSQAIDTHKLSNRQQEQRLREHFISARRVREWRDIHSQLQGLAAEQGWRMNTAPATYESLHMALLSGLLGNIGVKSDEGDGYLGARGIKFWRHPSSRLSKRPGRWTVAAELVETTRLFARGMANIEAPWLVRAAPHLLKTQLLDPHWEKKAADVIALERATLYGLVVYSNKRVSYGQVDAMAAREIFIREALVHGEWDGKLPFLAHNRGVIRDIEALEHKSRRQDVLVEDALIEAFYDAHIPADVVNGASMERWYRHAHRSAPHLLMLVREDLMRHQAAGITSAAFPSAVKLGGIDCLANYLHALGDARDGMTVTVPIYALNQVSEERCEWLVPGMLEAKVLALVKSLPQKPRARLVPLPTFAAEFCASVADRQSGLIEALMTTVNQRGQVAVQRQDFKLDQLPAHMLMNIEVVDEHGRHLGIGRNLATLKAELGTQARGAFQALANLRLGAQRANAAPSSKPVPISSATDGHKDAPSLLRALGDGERFTAWTFGELPEMLEIKRGTQSLIGFPALMDHLTHVEIEVFDEPDVAALKHREGLRRLLTLTLKEPLKYVEKGLPDFHAMSMAFMPLGTSEDLRAQIVQVALDRAFLSDPLPTDASAFAARVEEGRTRLSLVSQEVARLTYTVLTDHASAVRKLRDAKPPKEVADDVQAQLQGLVGKQFITQTPWAQMQHLPRYLKAVVLRLEKLKTDAARDAQRMGELRPMVQRFQRKSAALRGAKDARLTEYRWLLEELRVSFFAQALRTPTPVSVKRLDKVWAQVES